MTTQRGPRPRPIADLPAGRQVAGCPDRGARRRSRTAAGSGAYLLVLALAYAVAPAALAQETLVPVRQSGTLAAPLVASAPKLDGRLDDAAWQRAQPLRLWAYKATGVRCQTEGWICRDQSNLYLAARCFEPDLAGLVTEFQGRALWKNDCIELFVVAEKRELFFSHVIVACDGRVAASTWVPDEWGEPTRGAAPKITAAAGREKDAWTVEVAIPVSAFGFALSPKSVWALGFNREKHSEPSEVSSYQGGFNRPREYPDLVFDARAILPDGLGVRNIGAAPQNVAVVLATESSRKEHAMTVPPGKTVALTLADLPEKPKEGQTLTVTVSQDGKTILQERYLLAPPAKKIEPVDVAKIAPARFVKTVLDDPGFFPVGVWVQPAGQAAKYKAMGVNVYVGGVDSYPRPQDAAFLDAIREHGMYAICPYKKQYLDEKLCEHPAFIGWMFGDEPDNVNAQTGQVGTTPEALLAQFARIRRDEPTHPVYLNLGCGVADERFVGRGATDEQYAQYPQACDIISYDVYPCNSIQPNGPDRLHLVAKGVDRLRKWSGPGKRVWCWIEANKISKGPGRSPTPQEVKTQIWMALVHGARGYGFFCHSWAEARMTVSGIAPEMQAALAKVNAEVHALAAVLNSPSVPDAATVTPVRGGRVDVMVKAAKKHGGAVYVLAVNMHRTPQNAAIAVKGLADGRAEVLFEDRTVEVKAGRIADDFAPYAVHRYKVGG